MANGVFKDYAPNSYNSLGVKIVWNSEPVQYENASNITVKTYICYQNISIGPTTCDVTIGDSNYSISVPSLSNSDGHNKEKLVSTKSVKVAHDKNGNRKVFLKSKWNCNLTYNGSYWASLWADGTATLDRIDMSPPSIAVNIDGITSTGFSIYAQSNNFCTNWKYSINNGTSFTSFGAEGNTASIDISGLFPGKEYYVIVSATKKSNGISGQSTSTIVSTLGASVITSVENVQIDISNAIIRFTAMFNDPTYTHKLSIKTILGEIIYTINPIGLIVGRNQLSIPEDKRLVMLQRTTGKSQEFVLELITYSGESIIGTPVSTKMLAYTTPENSSPSLSNFGLIDRNDTTISITGSGAILVQKLSSIMCVINGATARNGATISRYSLKIGGKSVTNASSQFLFGPADVGGTTTAIASVIDSRGYMASIDMEINIIPYSKISVKNISGSRYNSVYPGINLTASGNCSSISVNGVRKNKIIVARINYKKTSETTWAGSYDILNWITYNTDGYEVSLSNILNLDPGYSWDISFEVFDSFGFAKESFLIGQGIPLISFRNKKVGINNINPLVGLDINGGLNIDGHEPLYFKGSLLKPRTDGHTPDPVNLGNVISPGIYSCFGNDHVLVSDIPCSYGLILIIGDSVKKGNCWQFMFDYYIANGFYMRRNSGGSWSSWYKFIGQKI